MHVLKIPVRTKKLKVICEPASHPALVPVDRGNHPCRFLCGLPEMLWGLRRVEHAGNTCGEDRRKQHARASDGNDSSWIPSGSMLLGGLKRQNQTVEGGCYGQSLRNISVGCEVGCINGPSEWLLYPHAICIVFLQLFLREMESNSPVLNLVWPCDLLWPIECGRNDAMPNQSPGVKGLTWSLSF